MFQHLRTTGTYTYNSTIKHEKIQSLEGLHRQCLLIYNEFGQSYDNGRLLEHFDAHFTVGDTVVISFVAVISSFCGHI